MDGRKVASGNNFFSRAIDSVGKFISSYTVKDFLGTEFEVSDKIIAKLTVGEIREGQNKKTGEIVLVKIQTISDLAKFYEKKYGTKLLKTRDHIFSRLQIEEAILKLSGRHISSVTTYTLINGEINHFILKNHAVNSLKLHCSHDDVDLKLYLAMEMIKQIETIHDNNFLHLNLTIDSFLIVDEKQQMNNNQLSTRKFNYKIILHDDFSDCEKAVESQTYAFGQLRGTHIPNEIFFQQKACNKVIKFSKSTDIFALGMVFYELFYNDPFASAKKLEFSEYHTNYSKYHVLAYNFLSSKNSPLAELIMHMINFEEDKRPTISDIRKRFTVMQHKGKNILSAQNENKNEIANSSNNNNKSEEKPSVPKPVHTQQGSYTFNLFSLTGAAVVAAAAVGTELLRRWTFDK